MVDHKVAERVVMRSPLVANQLISSNQYRQMVGRARVEAIIISENLDIVRSLFIASPPNYRTSSPIRIEAGLMGINEATNVAYQCTGRSASINVRRLFFILIVSAIRRGVSLVAQQDGP